MSSWPARGRCPERHRPADRGGVEGRKSRTAAPDPAGRPVPGGRARSRTRRHPRPGARSRGDGRPGAPGRAARLGTSPGPLVRPDAACPTDRPGAALSPRGRARLAGPGSAVHRAGEFEGPVSPPARRPTARAQPRPGQPAPQSQGARRAARAGACRRILPDDPGRLRPVAGRFDARRLGLRGASRARSAAVRYVHDRRLVEGP